ncbi:MAG: hypothetical protein H7177_17345, partial [Rhizobacter sp.]|nr:hypothetical protein [Bacteriovorax sp.]
MKSFYLWIKDHTTENPSRELDAKIKAMAHKHLTATYEPKGLSWKFISLPLGLAAVVAVIINVRVKQQDELTAMALKMPVEMILNYNEMELMADSAILTDNDWDEVAKVK